MRLARLCLLLLPAAACANALARERERERKRLQRQRARESQGDGGGEEEKGKRKGRRNLGLLLFPPTARGKGGAQGRTTDGMVHGRHASCTAGMPDLEKVAKRGGPAELNRSRPRTAEPK